jgi:hypothetical protein
MKVYVLYYYVIKGELRGSLRATPKEPYRANTFFREKIEKKTTPKVPLNLSQNISDANRATSKRKVVPRGRLNHPAHFLPTSFSAARAISQWWTC